MWFNAEALYTHAHANAQSASNSIKDQENRFVRPLHLVGKRLKFGKAFHINTSLLQVHSLMNIHIHLRAQLFSTERLSASRLLILDLRMAHSEHLVQEQTASKSSLWSPN